MSLTRSCMSDRIKKELMHRICEGIYQPGDRLIELQIAREFETSQAPVREALCELQIMGIVETEPYKGTHVKEISTEELEESIKIRAALESLAAESVDERMLHKIETLRKKAVETVKYARQRKR
jgi:DNA-binding GntR family transcriptional regulator